MITRYQISIIEGRVHFYVIAGYDVLLGKWDIHPHINFIGGESRELLPTECYDGLPTFGINAAGLMGVPHFVQQMAQDYAERINKQIGDGPLPVPTQGENEE